MAHILVYEYLLMSWVLRPCMYIPTYPLKQLVLNVFMFNQCAALRICLCMYIYQPYWFLPPEGGGGGMVNPILAGKLDDVR